MGDSYTPQGDNSQNISGKNVRIENMNLINAPSSGGGGEPPIKAERSLIIKLPFLSVNRLFFGGLIIAGPIGIYHFFKTFIWFFSDHSSLLFSIVSSIPGSLPFSLFLIFVTPLMLGMIFTWGSRSLGASFLGNLERSPSGDIYYTRVQGTCPRCSAPMRMVKGHNFACRDSFDHMIKFDMTTLPDVAEDYARRRSGGDTNRGGGDDTSAHDDDTGAR